MAGNLADKPTMVSVSGEKDQQEQQPAQPQTPASTADIQQQQIQALQQVIQLLQQQVNQNQQAAQKQAEAANQPIKVQSEKPVKVEVADAPEKEFNNRVTFNALGLLIGIGNISIEHAFSKVFSLELTPVFGYYYVGSGFGGGGASLGMNIYPMAKAPRGLKVTLLGGGAGVVKDNSSDSDTTAIAWAKATVGYNWIWNNGFTLGLGGGVQYLYVGNPGHNGANVILPTAELSLGFAF
jgi:hypothetical protein